MTQVQSKRCIYLALLEILLLFLLYLVYINISYDHLNIGQLLFLLPNAELKQSVRNLELF